MSNTSPTSATVVSVGYQARSLDEFIEDLIRSEVQLVVDVRLTPVSRKKGFSKTALARALQAAAIGYRHERELGNPKDNREAFRQGKQSAVARYDRHLENGADSVFRAIAKLAFEERTALLCVEDDHRACHRSRIADRLREEYPAISITII